MAHPRKLIRDKVVSLLSGSIPAVGSRVYSSRSKKLWRESLPAIAVYTRIENISINSTSPLDYKRDIRLVIEIADDSPFDVDDRLDDIAEAVELIIFTNWSLDDLAENTILFDSEYSADPEGSGVAGSLRMEFQVFVNSYAPEDVDVPNELKRIFADWNLENEQHEDITGQDIIEYP